MTNIHIELLSNAIKYGVYDPSN